MASCKKGPARWLLGELPQLQETGVIDAASAGNLREHYTRLLETPGQGRTMAVLMLSVLGSLLIGGGVIMLLAHNWDELPKWLRLAVAFLPLVIAQSIGGWALWKDKSLSLRECAGTLTPLGVIAVISIVAQVYNISGDPAKFYFTACLLSLPVIYIYRSTAAAILCMALICFLGLEIFGYHSSQKPDMWKYWICVLSLVPFVVFMFRRHGQTTRAFWLAVGCIVLLIFQTCYAIDDCDMMSMPIFGMLASVLWLLGRTSEANRWAMAFKALATIGLLVIFAIASFDWPWEMHRYRENPLFYTKMPLWWYGFIWTLFAGNVLLLLRTAARKDWVTFLPGLSGLMLLGIMIFCGIYDLQRYVEYDYHATASIVTSLGIFFGGVAVMMLSIRHEKIFEMNFGMLLAAMTIVFRFFDSEYSFTVKGLVFILVGVLFLSINWLTVRKFRRAVK